MTVLRIRVVCRTPGCAKRGQAVNTVLVSGDEDESAVERVEQFFEAFGHGGEDTADFCPACGELGVAEEPEEATT
ncbi:MAG: hypothetical protein AB1938_26870 [Myxococcota bacterium]